MRAVLGLTLCTMLVACGNTPSLRTNQSISHFQFFFSIWQSF